jgi:hypothetical protein
MVRSHLLAHFHSVFGIVTPLFFFPPPHLIHSFNQLLLCGRFGRPSYVQEARKAWATNFFNVWAPACMNSVLGTCRGRGGGGAACMCVVGTERLTSVCCAVRCCAVAGFLKFHAQTGLATNPILQSCFVFLSDAITHSRLYKPLKPHLNFIMFESLLPVLCLTKDDLHTWSTDPHEFVRKSLDVMEEFVDPRVSGSGLLTELIRVRTRDTLNPCLSAIASIVNTYAAAPNEKKNYIQKEGALRMFGNMRKLLLSKKELKGRLLLWAVGGVGGP